MKENKQAHEYHESIGKKMSQSITLDKREMVVDREVFKALVEACKRVLCDVIIGTWDKNTLHKVREALKLAGEA